MTSLQWLGDHMGYGCSFENADRGTQQEGRLRKRCRKDLEWHQHMGVQYLPQFSALCHYSADRLFAQRKDMKLTYARPQHVVRASLAACWDWLEKTGCFRDAGAVKDPEQTAYDTVSPGDVVARSATYLNCGNLSLECFGGLCTNC